MLPLITFSIVIFMFVSVIVCILIFTRKNNETHITYRNYQTSNEPIPQIIKHLPYHKKYHILTEAEFQFYSILRNCINPNFIICPKVGLKDFIYISKREHNYMHYWGKISQKHVDFLICDTKFLSPICAIELDDSSHNKPLTIERDNFVNDLYKCIQLPLVRFRVQNSYNMNDIINSLPKEVQLI